MILLKDISISTSVFPEPAPMRMCSGLLMSQQEWKHCQKGDGCLRHFPPSNPREEEYNESLSKTRIVVERAFGIFFNLTRTYTF